MFTACNFDQEHAVGNNDLNPSPEQVQERAPAGDNPNQSTLNDLMNAAANFLNNPGNQGLQVELFNTFNQFDERIDIAEDNIEDMSLEISNMNERIGLITGEQIASFQAEVDTSISSLENQINGHEEAIRSTRGQIAAVESSFGVLQEQVNGQLANQNELLVSRITAVQNESSSLLQESVESMSNEVSQRLDENHVQMENLSESVESQIAESQNTLSELSEQVTRLKVIRNYRGSFTENQTCGSISAKQFFMNSSGIVKDFTLNIDGSGISGNFNLPNNSILNSSENENWIVEIKFYKGENLLHSEQAFYSEISRGGFSIADLDLNINAGDVLTVTAQLDIGRVTSHDYFREGYPRIYVQNNQTDEKWEHCVVDLEEEYPRPKYTRKNLVLSFDMESNQPN